MADENGELSDAQKLKYLEELIQQGAANPSGNANASSAASDETLGVLKDIRDVLKKPTTLNTDNPELKLIVNGREKGVRYMTLNSREVIQVPGFGEAMRLEWPARTNDGPTGFQRTYYPTKILYMSEKQFYDGIPGKFEIDYKDYCRPPLHPLEKEAEERFGKVGTIQDDGTRFAGVDLDTKEAMFIEQADQPLHLTFNGAQKRAYKRSSETGDNYVVPTAGQLRKIFNNVKQGSYFTVIERTDKTGFNSRDNLGFNNRDNNSRDNVGFDVSHYDPDSYYQTSTEAAGGSRVKAVRSTDSSFHFLRKTKHLPTRLVKLVPFG